MYFRRVFEEQKKSKRRQVKTCRLLYERDGFTVTAIFTSIYAVLKGFTLISTKA